MRALKTASILLALKLIAGCAAAIAVLLNGVKFNSCPPGTYCAGVFDFYSMRLDLWSGFTTLVALGLLLSALKDLMVGFGRIEILERDVESIAEID